MIKHVLPTFLQKRGRYFLFLTGSLLLACLFAIPRQADALVADPQFSINRSTVHNITLALTQTTTIYLPLAANSVPGVPTQPTATATQPAIVPTRPTSTATQPAATATRPAATATQPAPTATRPAATATQPAGTTPQPTIGEWQPETYYQVGALVSYNGAVYRCRQAHTALLGWEPPDTPTLWQLVPEIVPTATPTFATPTPTATPLNYTPVPTIASNWPSRVFAPYMDITLSASYSVSGLATTLGQKYFVLAFVLSRGACTPSWGSVSLTDINNLRAQGGDVMPAFGGANGIELAQSCTTVESLQAQYQSFIDRYNFTALDFDIEGAAVSETASVTRRNQAIAGLQATAARAGKPLRISYTLPVWPSGLTPAGVNLLKDAVRNGVDIAMVNIMTMDYGSAGPPDKMGENAINAGNSLFRQLKTIYPTKTDAQLWSMIGLTPMIGQNDVRPEVFTLDDARAVLAFAQEKQIGMLSMWSVARDQACPNGGTYVSPTCSGITQTQWDFMNIFKPFTAP